MFEKLLINQIRSVTNIDFQWSHQMTFKFHAWFTLISQSCILRITIVCETLLEKALWIRNWSQLLPKIQLEWRCSQLYIIMKKYADIINLAYIRPSSCIIIEIILQTSFSSACKSSFHRQEWHMRVAKILDTKISSKLLKAWHNK